ncbi:HEPN domain-containing protein [candidate division WOR-3 bacterium]|nr:HEPN domain-containing protein [candidate division WOR-3 bacterium]
MSKAESSYPADWFRIADRDLRRCRLLLDGDDYPGAGFHLQQAVEKYIKGYLLTHGWKLRRIHDLETLLNEAVKLDASLEEFREPCRRVTQYYLEDRYPYIVASELTAEEIQESLRFAERIVAKLRPAT